MYDPTIGRWISEDPIGFAGGDPNLYRYVGNSPTLATDPTGLVAFEHKSGKPSSNYDEIWKKVEASYNSRKVDALIMQHFVIPIQTLTQDAIAVSLSLGMKFGSAFLSHYAANVGTQKDVDLNDFLGRDSGAWDWANGLARDAVTHADANWQRINKDGGAFRSDMTYTAASEREYAVLLGHYGAWIQGSKIRCKNGVMTMNLTYSIDDVYDFDITDKGGIGLPWKKILRVADLAAMHEFGQMRAFRVGGAIELSATWQQGNPGSLELKGLPKRSDENSGGGPY